MFFPGFGGPNASKTVREGGGFRWYSWGIHVEIQACGSWVSREELQCVRSKAAGLQNGTLLNFNVIFVQKIFGGVC